MFPTRAVNAVEFDTDAEIASMLTAGSADAGEGLAGLDVLVAINDCCCKTPLLDALKTQTALLSKEKGFCYASHAWQRVRDNLYGAIFLYTVGYGCNTFNHMYEKKF